MSGRNRQIDMTRSDRIGQWNAEIDETKAKVDAIETEAARRQRDEADAKPKDMRAASDAARDGMRTSVDRAMDCMSDAFNTPMSPLERERA